jgi:hypothetical protein
MYWRTNADLLRDLMSQDFKPKTGVYFSAILQGVQRRSVASVSAARAKAVQYGNA